MAAITVTLAAVCTGGNHLRFVISGDHSLVVRSSLSDMLEPITDEDVQGFLKVVSKMAKAGRTNAQARALLQASVTVNV